MEQNIIYDSVRCKASEIGKIIVNKCLNSGIKINTIKLEKLLVLMYGKLLSEYDKKLFNEIVVCTDDGVKIKEVDQDFIPYAVEFTNKFAEYICLLEIEENVIDDVLKQYGKLSSPELNELYLLKTLKKICEKNITNVISASLIKEVFSYNYYVNRLSENTSLKDKYEEKQKLITSAKQLIKNKKNFVSLK